MLGCKWKPLFCGSHFLCTPFFIACVPDRTLSDLPLPHPEDRFSSRLQWHLPGPSGGGFRRTDQSPVFSATRPWLLLVADLPGFGFPPESAAIPQPCRCSAGSPIPNTSRLYRSDSGRFFFAHIAWMRFLKLNDSIPQILSRCNPAGPCAGWNCSQMLRWNFVQPYKNEKVLYQSRTKSRFHCLPSEGTFTKTPRRSPQCPKLNCLPRSNC